MSEPIVIERIPVKGIKRSTAAVGRLSGKLEMHPAHHGVAHNVLHPQHSSYRRPQRKGVGTRQVGSHHISGCWLGRHGFLGRGTRRVCTR
jgi:hypothetical protein